MRNGKILIHHMGAGADDIALGARARFHQKSQKGLRRPDDIRTTTMSESDLGDYEDAPVVAGCEATQHALAVSLAIDVRGVEQIDPGLDRRSKHAFDLAHRHRVVERAYAAATDPKDRQVDAAIERSASHDRTR